MAHFIRRYAAHIGNVHIFLGWRRIALYEVSYLGLSDGDLWKPGSRGLNRASGRQRGYECAVGWPMSKMSFCTESQFYVAPV